MVIGALKIFSALHEEGVGVIQMRQVAFSSANMTESMYFPALAALILLRKVTISAKKWKKAENLCALRVNSQTVLTGPVPETVSRGGS